MPEIDLNEQGRITVSEAGCNEATFIVQLVQASFPPQVVSATIFGHPKVSKFIRAQLRLPPAAREFRYLVGLRGSEPAGCIVTRSLFEQLHVDYVAVSASSRGMGLGRALLVEALAQDLPALDRARVTVDVLVGNLSAADWYRRLGFREQSRASWYVIDLPSPRGSSTAIVTGYAHATASLLRFGHGNFSIATQNGKYAVGCLGDRWFRVADRAAVVDRELLATLADISNRRQLLAILPSPDKEPADPRCGRPFAETIRMTVGGALLADRLAERQESRRAGEDEKT